MKKLFIASALVLSVQFASAQSEDFKKDVVTYIKMSGAAANMTAVLEPVIEQIPADKREDFKKDLESILPGLYDKMAVSIMKHYTHDDIKKMMEFYNSPIGKKIQEVTPKMTKEQMQAGQDWGMELQGIIMKYMQ